MSEYNVQQQQDEDEIVIDLRVLFCDLWKGLKKLWWVFLILCSLMAGMNYVQSAVRYAPMYESKMRQQSLRYVMVSFMSSDRMKRNRGRL